MRYFGQRYEVSVPLGTRPFAETDAARIKTAFYEAYRDYYGREISDVPIETVSWRLNVSGPQPELDIAWPGRIATADGLAAKAERLVTFPGDDTPIMAQVFERGQLPVGVEIPGPCLIEDHESTTVVPKGARLSVDGERMLIINISEVLR